MYLFGFSRLPGADDQSDKKREARSVLLFRRRGAGFESCADGISFPAVLCRTGQLRSSFSAQKLHCLYGRRNIRFSTHGHLYNVKHEPVLESLASAARAEGAGLVLYGHTHTANLQQKDGITFLNPGALVFTSEPSYAVLTAEKGNFTAEIRTFS